MRTWKTVCVAILLAALPAASVLFVTEGPARQAQASSKTATFTTYQLGTQFIGESCPSSTTPCTNGAAEPATRADAAGNLFGSSENGLGGGFTQVAATPVIHEGGVCEGGVTCQGNRDLYDNFGVAASPATGMTSIIYSDDQYDSSQPTKCAQSSNDTATCNHTNVATQTGGVGIYATK